VDVPVRTTVFGAGIGFGWLFECIKFPAKVIDYFLRSNKSNINEAATVAQHYPSSREFEELIPVVNNVVEEKARQINSENRILSRMSSTANRQCEAYTSWVGPAPTWMIR